MSKYLRHPKSKNEMTQSADPEIVYLVRAKRHVANLANARDDYPRCPDIDTKKQIRQSQRSYRDSIKFFPVLEEGIYDGY